MEPAPRLSLRTPHAHFGGRHGNHHGNHRNVRLAMEAAHVVGGWPFNFSFFVKSGAGRCIWGSAQRNESHQPKAKPPLPNPRWLLRPCRLWLVVGNGNPRMKRIRRTRAQHAARPGRGGDREIPRNTAVIASQRHTKPALLRWALHPPPSVSHQNRGFSCAQRSAIHVAYCAQASRRTFESFRCGCAIGGGCVVGASENTVR